MLPVNLLIISWLRAGVAPGRQGVRCLAVSDALVRIRDLAPLGLGLVGADPNRVLFPAPAPGKSRRLNPSVLDSFTAPASARTELRKDICIEREAAQLAMPDLIAALTETFPLPGIHFEIVEYSRYPVPAGKLSFPRSGLQSSPVSNPEAALFWRGHVLYDERKTMTIWVKVKISARHPAVVSKRPLPAGRPVSGEDLEVRSIPGLPPTEPLLGSAAEAAGLVPRRLIRAGEPLSAKLLARAKDVERGDKVAVVVRSGAASLTFDGTAETSASTGELLIVRNPENGKRLKANVEGKGRASVNAHWEPSK